MSKISMIIPPCLRQAGSLVLGRPQEPRQVEALAALEQLRLRLRLLTQAPDANEALGGVVIELIAVLVGREVLVVEAKLALATGDRGLPLEQLHPHLSGDKALVAGDEGEQVLVEGAEPQ